MEPTATTGQKRATGENTESALTEPVVPSEGTAEMDAVDLSMALRKLQVRTQTDEFVSSQLLRTRQISNVQPNSKLAKCVPLTYVVCRKVMFSVMSVSQSVCLSVHKGRAPS